MGSNSGFTVFITPGECEMKIGTTLFLLIAILFASGFFCNAYIQQYQELNQLKEELRRRDAQITSIEQQINADRAQIDQDKQTISQLGDDLKNAQNELVNQNSALETLKNEIINKDKEILVLQDTVTQLNQKSATVQNGQPAVSNIPVDVSGQVAGSNFIQIIMAIILIAQVGLAVVQVKYHFKPLSPPAYAASGQYIKLNPSELAELIEKRRKKG